MAELSDVDITRMARARVAFKMHLMAYVAVNLFLAAVWWVGANRWAGGEPYWPIWTHLGWGLGLLMHGFFAMGPGLGMQAREEAALRERYGRKKA